MWGYHYPLLQPQCVFNNQHSQPSQTVFISHKTKYDSSNQNQASFENREISSSSRSESVDSISQDKSQSLIGDWNYLVGNGLQQFELVTIGKRQTRTDQAIVCSKHNISLVIFLIRPALGRTLYQVGFVFGYRKWGWNHSNDKTYANCKITNSSDGKCSQINDIDLACSCGSSSEHGRCENLNAVIGHSDIRMRLFSLADRGLLCAHDNGHMNLWEVLPIPGGEANDFAMVQVFRRKALPSVLHTSSTVILDKCNGRNESESKTDFRACYVLEEQGKKCCALMKLPLSISTKAIMKKPNLCGITNMSK